MDFTLTLIFFLCAVRYSTTSNITIYIENAQYRGHYLTSVVTSATAGTVNVTNPPLGNQHKWTVDWDRIFIAPGSPILSTPTLSAGMLHMTPPPSLSMQATLAVPAVNWTMKYHVIDNNQFLYQFESTAGCLFDTGLLPILQVPAECTISNMRAFWKVYSA